MQPLSPQAYWYDLPAASPVSGPLDGDRETDIAIVGGGITGLTAAMHLADSGQRVIILEAGVVGGGTTGGTSGHLDVHPEQGFDKLLGDFGAADARLMTLARQNAIDQIERWSREWSPDCDFVRVPAYLYAEDDAGTERLAREHQAAEQIGISASMAREVPLAGRATAALRLDRQARFHPLAYLRGLARRLREAGVEICEQTRVLKLPDDGEPCTIETDRGTVRARAVILATHSTFLGITTLDARVAPYQSYVIAAEVDDDLEDALFWDLASPYHYIRRAGSQTPAVYLIGGEDHKTGQADERECLAKLEEYARSKFRVRSIRSRWSAELFEPADGAPLIGRVPLSQHLYLATGLSGVGLTWGTVAGRLLAARVLGSRDQLSDVVSPARLKPVAAGSSLARENLNVARHFVMDRFGAPELDSLHELGSGEGMIVKHDGQLAAVHRDAAGELHACSAICTHAGCVVQWNSSEQTWDCPCHGGRFRADGQRLYGPPPADLNAIQLPART